MADGRHEFALVGYSQDLERKTLKFVEPIPAARICSACSNVPRLTYYLLCGHTLCEPCYECCVTTSECVCPLDGEVCATADVTRKEYPAENLLRRPMPGDDDDDKEEEEDEKGDDKEDDHKDDDDEEEDEGGGDKDGALGKKKKPPDSMMVQRKSASRSGGGTVTQQTAEAGAHMQVILTIVGLLVFVALVVGVVGFIVYKIVSTPACSTAIVDMKVFDDLPVDQFHKKEVPEKENTKNVSAIDDNTMHALDYF